jgi:hypothetical protein
MRRTPLAFTLALALATPSLATPTHVGDELTVQEATPIATILATPDDYVGKLVRVEGEVTGVCTRMGCWMDIADEAGRSIRIQVEDGVLVFPSDAAGKPAAAQGKVTVEELPRDRYVAWRKHMAEEGGEPFDESKLGDGPYRLVSIAGTGADVGE